MNTTSEKRERSLIRCSATRFNDQMMCNRCGLQWDIDDPDRPDCLTTEELKKQRGMMFLSQAKKTLKS